MRKFLVGFFALVLAACGGSATTPSTSSAPSSAASARVDGPAARELVKNGAQLVDVRSPEEFAEKHIDGAVNVPIEGIASHDFGGKDKAVVLYCHTGHRSGTAAETLRAAGYTKVYLLGPMSAWGN